MPIVPDGFTSWCLWNGLDQHHPELWAEGDHAAFIAWKVALAEETIAWYAARDQEALDGPARWAERCQRLRDDAQVRLARNPFSICPCHDRLGHPRQASLDSPEIVTPAEVAAWRGEDLFGGRAEATRRRARAEIVAQRHREAEMAWRGDDPARQMVRPGVARALAVIERSKPEVSR